MFEVFETIINSKAILDPEFELFLCHQGLRVSINSKGYPKTNYQGKSILLSRLVLRGKVPPHLEVDHINGDPLDTREFNLRIVTHTQNMWNSKIPKTNKSGVKGISQDSISLLFVACIWANKIRYRKKFKSFERASAWRKEMERTHHGVYSRKPPL